MLDVNRSEKVYMVYNCRMLNVLLAASLAQDVRVGTAVAPRGQVVRGRSR